MKIRWRRYKKWDQLTQAEKIEQLKMESERPYYTWHILVILVAFVAVISLYLLDMNIVKVNDLYNQTGLTMSDSTSQYIDAQWDKLYEIGNGFGILMLIFVAVMIISTVWHQWKWRKFTKQTKIVALTEKQLKKEWEAKK